MDTNVLKTFIAVCEYAGFSAAAEKLAKSSRCYGLLGALAGLLAAILIA